MNTARIVDQLSEHFGSQTEIARLLQITRAAVSYWRKNGIPAERAHELARLSNGRFAVSDIRPDLRGRV